MSKSVNGNKRSRKGKLETFVHKADFTLIYHFISGPTKKDTVSKHCDVLACVETWFVFLKVRQPLQLSLVLLLCC